MIHIYQVIKKEFQFSSFSAEEQIRGSFRSEVKAYRVTYSLIGISGVFHINNITTEWIKNNYNIDFR